MRQNVLVGQGAGGAPEAPDADAPDAPGPEAPDPDAPGPETLHEDISTKPRRSMPHRELVHDATELVPGTRVLAASPVADQLVAREQDWLDSLASWTRQGPYADLIRSAYQDMYLLTEGLDAPVAGWSDIWQYVWPRDAAHIAVACAYVGDVERALRSFEFLERVPRTGQGWFEARYHTNGSGSPDRRAPQFDGLGWTGWALGRIYTGLALGEIDTQYSHGAFLEQVETLARNVAQTLIGQIVHHNGAPVSPDYWESKEKTVTLGTIGATLAGLEGLAAYFTALGDDSLTTQLALAFEKVVAQVDRDFAPHGYGRRASEKLVDSAIPFLVPLYVDRISSQSEVYAALREAQRTLTQPAGGVTPGESWAKDGVPWTPETGIFALAFAHSTASLDNARAHELIQLLGQHRTQAGSYSEKILHNGTPVAVSPLAWTASGVALTAFAVSN